MQVDGAPYFIGLGLTSSLGNPILTGSRWLRTATLNSSGEQTKTLPSETLTTLLNCFLPQASMTVTELPGFIYTSMSRHYGRGKGQFQIAERLIQGKMDE